jgi:hypothetical protein
MLRGPLHDRGADGRCTECGEPFPCPTGLAIFDAVTRELEQPAPPPAAIIPPPSPPTWSPPEVRWEDLEGRADRCPRCLHWWVSHGVPTEDGYGCSMPTSSMDERERGIYEVCGCEFTEGNTVTPRQVRIWTDGTSWPLAPEDRANCGHYRRGPIREDDSQQCLDCGVVFVSDGRA